MQPIYPDLNRKKVVVTGGNTGIGLAIARRFAEQHVQLVIVGSRHPEKTDLAVAQLREMQSEVLGLTADLTQGAGAAQMIAAVTRELGTIDILVNCAGGFYGRKTVLETDESEWDAILDINLKSTFLCSKAALPGMIEQRWGRIINISSEAGRMPVALTAAPYAAAKAGILGFTRHLAREVAGSGVTVNATAPATTYSDRVRANTNAEFIEAALRITPIGRIAEPDDQAGVVVFLASEAAAYITGATIDVAGGKVML